MLVLVLCRFRVPIVNNVAQRKLNYFSGERWATTPKNLSQNSVRQAFCLLLLKARSLFHKLENSFEIVSKCLAEVLAWGGVTAQV
jgi:hypothetical protein